MQILKTNLHFMVSRPELREPKDKCNRRQEIRVHCIRADASMRLSCWEMPRDFTNETLHVAKYYLSPLITAEMSDYQALLRPRICSFFFFTTMPLKAKLSRWVTKEKSFLSDKSKLTQTLVSANMYPRPNWCISRLIVRFVLACTVVCGWFSPLL